MKTAVEIDIVPPWTTVRVGNLSARRFKSKVLAAFFDALRSGNKIRLSGRALSYKNLSDLRKIFKTLKLERFFSVKNEIPFTRDVTISFLSKGQPNIGRYSLWSTRHDRRHILRYLKFALEAAKLHVTEANNTWYEVFPDPSDQVVRSNPIIAMFWSADLLNIGIEHADTKSLESVIEIYAHHSRQKTISVLPSPLQAKWNLIKRNAEDGIELTHSSLNGTPIDTDRIRYMIEERLSVEHTPFTHEAIARSVLFMLRQQKRISEIDVLYGVAHASTSALLYDLENRSDDSRLMAGILTALLSESASKGIVNKTYLSNSIELLGHIDTQSERAVEFYCFALGAFRRLIRYLDFEDVLKMFNDYARRYPTLDLKQIGESTAPALIRILEGMVLKIGRKRDVVSHPRVLLKTYLEWWRALCFPKGPGKQRAKPLLVTATQSKIQSESHIFHLNLEYVRALQLQIQQMNAMSEPAAKELIAKMHLFELNPI